MGGAVITDPYYYRITGPANLSCAVFILTVLTPCSLIIFEKKSGSIFIGFRVGFGLNF